MNVTTTVPLNLTVAEVDTVARVIESNRHVSTYQQAERVVEQINTILRYR